LLLAAAAVASAGDGAGKFAYSNGASGGKLKWIAAGEMATAPAETRSGGPTLVRPVQHTDTEAASEKSSDAKPEKIGKPAPATRSDANDDGQKRGLQPFVKEPESVGPKLKAIPADASDNGAIDLGAAGGQKVEGCIKIKTLGPIDRKILDQVTPAPGKFPPNCPMARVEDTRRDWSQTEFHWTASALCAKPAYFSDVHLERYGHTNSPVFQPLVSAGHFFLSVPALPYAIGLYPPNECIYTLGYYRPGSCAPHYLDPLPISVRAAVLEAGTAVGLAAFIP
jgi:hypothetical protein